MGELPLLQDGMRRGTISVRADSVRTHFSVRCPDLGPGLYKVWLAGPSGRMLLGTLEPSGDCLALERACSVGALRSAGVCPPEWGELTVSGSGGPRRPPEVRQLPVRPKDAELRRVLEKSPPAWCDRAEEGWLLAWPWSVGMELPVPSLACLGWPEQVRGRDWFLLCLNEKGWPMYKPARDRKG